MPLGNTGLKLDLLLEICTTSPTGANPMLYLLVITMSLEPYNHAPPVLTLQNANKNADLNGAKNMKMTKLLDKLDTDSMPMPTLL